MDLSGTALVAVLSALIGSLSALTVGFLTHYSAEQRERLARQYIFREKQLQELYAPILASLLELTTEWELMDQLAGYRAEWDKSMSCITTVSLLPAGPQVHKYNIELHQKQLDVLEQIANIAKRNFYLAEPSTKEQIRKLFRSHANRYVVQYDIPIDATGEPIPSLKQPFSPNLIAFMQDVESQYNRLAKELRTAQFNELQTGNTVLVTSFPTLLSLPDTPGGVLEQRSDGKSG
jgi:hypothetical protein